MSDETRFQMSISISSDGKPVYAIWGKSEAVHSIIMTDEAAIVSFKKNDAVWIYKKIDPIKCLIELLNTNSLGKTMWYIKRNFTESEQKVADGVPTITTAHTV